MIQQAFSAMVTILLAKFVLNDLPHAAGIFGPREPSSPWDPPGSSGNPQYEELPALGRRSLSEGLRALRLEPYSGITQFFTPRVLSPSVGHTIKTFIVGYYLIAKGRAGSEVVDGTYLAVKQIWSGFLEWWGTDALEREVGGEEAKFVRESMSSVVETTRLGLVEVEAGGSKVIFIDSFVSNEHVENWTMLHGFMSHMGQAEPEGFFGALAEYISGLARGGWEE